MTVSDDPRALLQQAALHDRNGRLPETIAAFAPTARAAAPTGSGLYPVNTYGELCVMQ